MAKNGKEARLETPKTAARLPKISNTAKKYNRDENLESSNVRTGTFYATIG